MESGDAAAAGERGKALGNLRKSWSRRKDGKNERPKDSKERTEPATAATAVGDDTTRPGWEFVAEDFEGESKKIGSPEPTCSSRGHKNVKCDAKERTGPATTANAVGDDTMRPLRILRVH